MAGREVEAEAEQQLLEQREALQELQIALQDVDEASEDAAELLAVCRSLHAPVTLQSQCLLQDLCCNMSLLNFSGANTFAKDMPCSRLARATGRWRRP